MKYTKTLKSGELVLAFWPRVANICELFFFSILYCVVCVLCVVSVVPAFSYVCLIEERMGQKTHFGKIQWSLSSMKQVAAGRENVKASQTPFECLAWNFWWWQMCWRNEKYKILLALLHTQVWKTLDKNLWSPLWNFGSVS